jgi:hypothetical protein
MTDRRTLLLNFSVLEPRTDSPPRLQASSVVSPEPGTPASKPARTNPLIYLLALALGLLSGWVNQTLDDALLTSLCVLAFTMILGGWKKQHPWRWLVLVWIGVPLMLAYYQFIAKWPHSRGQVYAVFFQILAASAGAHGGHYMRDMIDHVFLKQDDI